MKRNSQIVLILVVLIVLAALAVWGIGSPLDQPAAATSGNLVDLPAMAEDGHYRSADDVALYLQTYGHLPANFMTKSEAIERGWDSDKGNLWEVTDKFSIGGDSFGNREGLLPGAPNRQWTECDVNYSGGFRGAERIVFSNDGLIYYSDDHYQSFTKID